MRILFGLLGIFLLGYGVGHLTGNPELAFWSARIQIEARPDRGGVEAMQRLEPERPESWKNIAIFTATSGSSAGAIRAFESAVGRAPWAAPYRFELARAWLWHAALATDSEAALDARRQAMRHLAVIRAAEPLHLAAVDASGDTVAFGLAYLALEALEARGEPKENLDEMRRTLD